MNRPRLAPDETGLIETRAIRAALVYAKVGKGGRTFRRLAAFRLLPDACLERAVLDLMGAGLLGLKRNGRGLFLVKTDKHESRGATRLSHSPNTQN